VIWAIGCSMVLLSALVFLPAWAVALLGAALVAGHNALDDLLAARGVPPTALVLAQLRLGPLFPFGQGPGRPLIFVAYPVLPWLGIMALGYGSGALWVRQAHRRAWLAGMGFAMVLLFIALRWVNGYGDPSPWSFQGSALGTLLSFLRCQKYPPSLDFALMTLGPALLLLAAFDRPPGPVGRVLVTFGRVPLFFYLLHVPLIHLAAIAIAYFHGGEVGFLFDHPLLGRDRFPPGYGYALPVVYLIWLGVVACLYPLCRWFEGVKDRSRSTWLSYL
jgi:uncharacterized membrane protein